MKCTNNLKQIGLALHNYHDTNNGFPAGWKTTGSNSTGYWGWGVWVLPYLEQQNLYNQLSPTTRTLQAVFQAQPALLQTPLTVYMCPSDTVSPLNDNRPFAVIGHPDQDRHFELPRQRRQRRRHRALPGRPADPVRGHHRRDEQHARGR